MLLKKNPLMHRVTQLLLVVVALFTFMGVGDEDARFNDLGPSPDVRLRLHQILLECNHVGCQYSDRMRGELAAAL